MYSLETHIKLPKKLFKKITKQKTLKIQKIEKSKSIVK